MSSDKKLAKIEKILGVETISEMREMPVDQLETKIVSASASIKETQDELEKNLDYQKLKESLKDISSGLKEVKKRQNAIIQYALYLLEQSSNS